MQTIIATYKTGQKISLETEDELVSPTLRQLQNRGYVSAITISRGGKVAWDFKPDGAVNVGLVAGI